MAKDELRNRHDQSIVRSNTASKAVSSLELGVRFKSWANRRAGATALSRSAYLVLGLVGIVNLRAGRRWQRLASKKALSEV